jgi:hypothetical protein
MKFTMAADKTVATKLGHSIEFKKGVATHVPKDCWRDVQAAGAVPEDATQVVEPVKTAAEQVVDADERKAAIFVAFEALVEANKREDFTAAGIPKTSSVAALTEFEIDSKERDALWIEFSQKGTG